MVLLVTLALAEGPRLFFQPLAAPEPLVHGRYLAGAASEDCSLFPRDCVDVEGLLALAPRDLWQRSAELSRLAQRMANDAVAVLELCGEAPCSPALRELMPIMVDLAPELAFVGARSPVSPETVTRRRLDYQGRRPSLTAEVLCSMYADPDATACTLTVRDAGTLALVYGGNRGCGSVSAQVAAADGSITYVSHEEVAELVLEGAAPGVMRIAR